MTPNAFSLSFTIYNILNNRKRDKILSKTKILSGEKEFKKNTSLIFFDVNVNALKQTSLKYVTAFKKLTERVVLSIVLILRNNF